MVLEINLNIGKNTVGLGNVENTALSTWDGSANITTLGTIVSAVWNGSAISDSYISSAAIWNAKQDAIGYTPENSVNKAVDFSVLNDVKYPTVKATNDQINTAISALVASSPTTLDTLNEIAVALGNDPNFSTTITTSLGLRVKTDGTTPLTASWDAGSFSITANSVIIGSASNTIAGGSASGGNLFLSSTTHGTKGGIRFGNSIYKESTNDLGIGTITPDVYSFGGTVNVATFQSANTMSVTVVAGGANAAVLTFGNATIRRGSIVSQNGSDLLISTNTSNTGTTLSEKWRVWANGNLSNDGSNTANAYIKLKAATTAIAPFQFTNPAALVSAPAQGMFQYFNNYVYITDAAATRMVMLSDTQAAITANRVMVTNNNGRLVGYDALNFNGTELNVTGNIKITSGQIYSNAHTITYAASIVPNLNNGFFQKVTLTNNVILANPTNMKDSNCFRLRITQGGIGGFTISSFGDGYYFPGGLEPLLSIGPGQFDDLLFFVDGAILVYDGIRNNPTN